jgi:hypothetical protein
MALKQIVTTTSLLAAALALILAVFRPKKTGSPYEPVRGKNNTVLFVANSEYGLSNVHLATAQALLEQHPSIDIHYASFSGAAKKIERLSLGVPTTKNISFHGLHGTSLWEKYMDNVEKTNTKVLNPPNAKGIEASMKQLQMIALPWAEEEYFRIYEQVIDVIDDVDPSVVILDVLLRPAISATWNSKRKLAFLAPNSLADSHAVNQPYGSFFWKYPR